MTDCLNEELRDRLPLLAHGTLDAAEAEAVRSHVSRCADCRAELAVLEVSRRVIDATVPRVDSAVIVAALPAPRLTVVPGEGARAAAAPRRRGSWMPRQYLAAAASLLIVASLASPLFRGAIEDPTVASGPDTSAAATSGQPGRGESPVSTAGFSVAAGLGDLSDDDLTTLLAELEQLEATIAAEPTSLRTPLASAPDGFF